VHQDFINCTQPDDVIHEKIINENKEMTGIPRGSYSVMLNDDLIDSKRGIGAKEIKGGVTYECYC
jgi:hypothetical protein